MNKHKAYWSVMGNEASEEKSVKQLDLEKFEKDLKIMIGKYGSTFTITAVRNTVTKLQSEE